VAVTRALHTWQAVALVAMAVGCEPSTPTQVLVVFEADEAVRSRGGSLRIDVFNAERQRQAWDISLVEGAPGATTFPVTLPLVPKNDDASRDFEVVGEVLDEAGAVFARQRAVSGYVDGELREVVLRFGADCVEVLCGFRTTCLSGTCEDACFDPTPRGRGGEHRPCEQPVDGGTTADAGVDAGPVDPTGCDDVHAGRVFCDGFEEDVAARWERVRQTNGTITRVDGPVYRGTSALEAQSTDGSAFVYVASDALDGATGDVWARFYAHVPADQEIVRLNLLYMGEEESPFGGTEVGLTDGGRLFASARPDEAMVETPTAEFPFGQWVCIEVHLFMDATAGSVELFMNDEAVGMASMVDTFPVSGFQTINAGLGLTVADQPPVAVALDELVADGARIGCDP